jgi:PAS domain S-box-containing protein
MSEEPVRPRVGLDQPVVATIVILLALIMLVVAWVGIRQSRSDSMKLLVMQGTVLLESLAQAADNAISAENSIDQLVQMRYSEIVTVLLSMRSDSLSEADLIRVANNHDLHAAYLFGAEAQLLAGAIVQGVQIDPPEFLGEEVAELLSQPEDRYVLLLDQRDGEVEWLHYYLQIANDLSSVVVLVRDAGYYVEALRQTQIGYLAQNMASASGVEYIVYQSTDGIIFASQKIGRLRAIESDPFLSTAIESDSIVHRLHDFEGESVLEMVRPYSSSDYPFGVLRVGLSLRGYRAVTRGFDYLMIGLTTALFILVVLAILYVSSRRRRREISRRFDQMRTVTGRLFEQMSTGVAAVGQDGKISLANEAFERTFGVSGCVGRVWDEVVADEQLTLAELQRVGSGSVELEFTREIATERRTLLLAVAGLTDTAEPSESIVAVVYDITRLKRLEHDNQRRERLSEMGNLAAGVAHEIRNPLNTIAIAIQRLASEFTPDHDADQYQAIAGQIRIETRRLNDIITRFLALARDQKRSRRPVRIDLLLADLGQLLKAEAGQRSLSLSIQSEPDLSVRADPDGLRQVFMNLFNNSKEAISGTGTIAITARRTKDQVEILFADSGPGIPADIREEIFQPYYSTKDAGTGLGLPTVHRIISDLDGEIAVDDQVREGATFVIRLPAAD